jgi:hypothetical protein
MSGDLTTRIMAAYRELVNRPGGTITLVQLRNRLGSVNRATLDRTLLDMDDQRLIQLEPDPDRAALTSEDREAAVTMCGQAMHLMREVLR